MSPAPNSRQSVAVPSYLLDHDDPSALFTRLQRVVIHMELLQKETVRNEDLSFGDFVILATLRKEAPPHQLLVSEVAEYVLRPMGSISQALDRVERAGLIERTHASTDRRKVVVSLTKEGARVSDRTSEAYNQTRTRVFDGMSPAELDHIDSAITALLVALDSDYEQRR